MEMLALVISTKQETFGRNALQKHCSPNSNDTWDMWKIREWMKLVNYFIRLKPLTLFVGTMIAEDAQVGRMDEALDLFN